MKKTLTILMAGSVALFVAACGDSGTNTVNKPANVASNANVATAPPVDTKAAEAEIRKLMDTTQAALTTKDAADTMEKIYADSYSITNIDGTKQNKAERLASLRSGEVKYTAFAYKDASITFAPDGNTAYVTTKLSMKGTQKGKSIDGDYNAMQNYTKTKDGWKQISAGATKVQAGKPVDGTAPPQKATGNVKVDSVVGDDIPPPKKK